MHARFPLLVAAALATMVPNTAIAQNTFEGVVTFNVTEHGDSVIPVRYSIKGSKVRMDLTANGMPVIMLYDRNARTVSMVIPAQQMYMEQTMNEASVHMDSLAAVSKIKWTGKKESIAGHECEYAAISDAEGTTDVCLAKGLGSFAPMRGGFGRGGGAQTTWEARLGDAFPLKALDNKGNVEMVVTSIQKKSLDNSLFTIPAGFTKMNMPMGGGGTR